jgi:glycosyltransferase involved in cell wall biosynthesis
LAISAAPQRPAPAISVIVIVYNMAREAPRTLLSLSAAYQRNIGIGQYEVIVIDNGSTPPFDPRALDQLQGDFRLIRIDEAKRSPVQAINRGLAEARGKLVGVMIDGARIASPGLIGLAAMADRLADRAVILSLGFHLGSEVQMKSVLRGYDQEQEDRLLAQSGWTEDGYRLFDVSVFAGSSAGGWFRPIGESNAIFLQKALWDELGGFDERFQTPGGGMVNLDTHTRAVGLPETVVVTLLGEGTFHQVHGGVATNAIHSPSGLFHAEYEDIRGHAFQMPNYESLYLGAVPANALESIRVSAQGAAPLSPSERSGESTKLGDGGTG